MRRDAIDRLFTRLSATYGRDWTEAMGITPVTEAKALWAHELAQWADNLQPVAWALENLPERCPNVIAFKHLCRSAPAAAAPRLPEPQADPARVAAELAKLGQLRAKPSGTLVHSMKAWAYELQARDQAGHKIGVYARKAYQEVVRHQAALQQAESQPA